MGKKRRLNRFIRKWIKSDLPDDRSPKVLLLGVTRIPTSPVPARRPCSLPLCIPNSTLPQQQTTVHIIQESSSTPARRNSLNTTRRQLIRRNSSKRRHLERRQSTSEDECAASNGESAVYNAESAAYTGEGAAYTCEFIVDTREVATSTSGSWRSPSEGAECCSNDTCSVGDNTTPLQSHTPSTSNDPCSSGPVMDRSVDSIGTCSLDVEASAADLSEWSEVTSTGTLKSASIISPSPEPHLPSYLSLACTVNGYCTTTNYDPVRLAKSRDASPHRLSDIDHLTSRAYPTYSIQNNLLSPPNLVPLPIHLKSKNGKMSEHTIAQHHHQEFYTSSKTIIKESHFASNLFAKDTVDACYENGHHNIKNTTVSFESQTKSASSQSKSASSVTTNGQSKCQTETTIRKEWKEENETKSFIKQRIERLYGPGALAQVVFPIKRQKSRTSESEKQSTSKTDEQNHKIDKLTEDSIESNIKQSTSSPTLPVMRHLRPEFRAQLPVISPRKSTETTMQKSSTVPTLKDEVKLNGHSKVQDVPIVVPVPEIKTIDIKAVTQDSGEKNGHYFLKILDGEAKRLLELAEQAEAELLANQGLSEEVIGIVRSASGKARLLVSQKMQQFRGLCTNNITQVEGEAFPTTNEDLQGFWDMVMLQVDQVNALFKEIDTLKANNWKEIKPTAIEKSTVNGSSNKPKKTVSRPRQTTAASEEARKQREAQRKQMIEERRRAMKAQNKPKESIEIYVPESS